VVKPHGLKGDVVVAPVTNRAERFQPGAVHLTDRGAFHVRSARRHQGRWIVRYEEISDRTAAEGFRGVVLRGEPIDVLDESEWWVHDLVGAQVVDRAGVLHGTVTEVEANPAHDILVLDTGGLVPVVFVEEVVQGQVVIDPPEGLLDADLVEANRAGVERRPARRKGGVPPASPPG